jgi:hypothetical protein
MVLLIVFNACLNGHEERGSSRNAAARQFSMNLLVALPFVLWLHQKVRQQDAV